MAKFNKAEKAIIRSTWQAWAKYQRLCWEVVSQHPEGLYSYFRLTEMCNRDPDCAQQLMGWYLLNQLCEELGIDYTQHAHLDAATTEAACAFELYSALVSHHARKSA